MKDYYVGLEKKDRVLHQLEEVKTSSLANYLSRVCDFILKYVDLLNTPIFTKFSNSYQDDVYKKLKEEVKNSDKSTYRLMKKRI